MSPMGNYQFMEQTTTIKESCGLGASRHWATNKHRQSSLASRWSLSLTIVYTQNKSSPALFTMACSDIQWGIKWAEKGNTNIVPPHKMTTEWLHSDKAKSDQPVSTFISSCVNWKSVWHLHKYLLYGKGRKYYVFTVMLMLSYFIVCWWKTSLNSSNSVIWVVIKRFLKMYVFPG